MTVFQRGDDIIKRSKRDLIICFLGPDGSGKTTLSELLLKDLKEMGFSPLRVWWLSGDDSIVRRMLKKLRGINEGEEGVSSSSKQAYSMKGRLADKLFRTWFPRIVLMDYLRFGIALTSKQRIQRKNDILILDRYYYDVIASISWEFEFSEVRRKNYLKLFSALLPSPDIFFIIRVSPETSLARKSTEIRSLGFAKENSMKHESIISYVSSRYPDRSMEIDNTGKLESAREEVLRKTLALTQMT